MTLALGMSRVLDQYLHRGDVVIAADGTVHAIILYDAKEPVDIQALLSVLEQ